MSAPNSFSMTRRRVPTWLRVTGLIAAVVAVVVVVWALLVAAAYGSTWLRLGPTLPAPTPVVTTIGSQEPRSPADAHTLLVVVVGRDGTLDASPALVQYGGGRTRPVVVVIPRELTVVAVGDARQSIADVHASGGVAALRQAVVDFTEVAIDDVLSVSPRELAQMLDLIGDFTHCDPTCAPLDGPAFLAAYELRDDIGRLEYLGAVFGSVAATIDRAFVVRHPRRTWRLVAALPQSVATTVSLRGSVLMQSFAGVRDSATPLWATTPLLRTTDGTVLAAPEPSMLQFAALRDGTAFPDAALVSVEDLRQELRDTVQVAVANAAGIQGLAAQVVAQLEQLGYQIVASGNASRFDAQQTELQFRADDPRAVYIAEEIAEALGDVVLRPQTDTVTFERVPVDVLILLGAKAAS